MSRAAWDVAVVGGGPAGAGAAIALAQQGARAVLFEAKTYPHHKVCGEFLSPEGMLALDLLGAARPLLDLHPPPIETVLLSAPSGVTWEHRLPAAAWGVSRYALDALLAERARATGVDVREGTPVTQVRGSLEDGFTLEARAGRRPESVHARTVIGAYGKRGHLDRTLGRAFFDRRHPFVALKAHFHGPPLPARLELHAFPGGYCGMSEVEDGTTNVCLLVQEGRFQAHGRGPSGVEGFIRWMGAQNQRLGAWLADAERVSAGWHSIAQIPFAPKQPLAGDVLMAGDAAGLIAPLAGDGIAMALDGGLLAAEVIGAFLSGRMAAEAVRRHYAQAWRQQFGGRLRLGRALQPIMLRPASIALALRLLNAFPAAGRYLFAHTRDARGLARPAPSTVQG